MNKHVTERWKILYILHQWDLDQKLILTPMIIDDNLSNLVCFHFNRTDTDKHRGGREAVTQTPPSQPASDEDNSLGYKGTYSSSFWTSSVCTVGAEIGIRKLDAFHTFLSVNFPETNNPWFNFLASIPSPSHSVQRRIDRSITDS